MDIHSEQTMIKACRRLFLLLALLASSLFCVSANATIAQVHKCQIDSIGAAYGGTQYFDTCQAAMNMALGAFAQPASSSCNPTYPSGGPCSITYNGGATSRTINWQALSCPSNSVLVGGSCQCSAGYAESGAACVVNTCPVGGIKTVNVTIGYTRTPDDSDTKAVGGVFNPWAGAPVCNAGCSMTMSEAKAAYISQTPNASGLYRNSIDAVMINSGSTCTASPSNTGDQAVNPSAAVPACPGSVGEVNGKLGCYGTAATPVTTTTKPSTVVPPVAGNPAASTVPTTGEGSGTTGAGRTPTAGTGGPSGGPAGAAVGGRGGTAGGTSSGTGKAPTTAGEEQAACGAPNQPQCKIDETGTPTAGDFTGGTTAMNTNQTTATDAITGAGSIQAPSWSFSFQLPTGCTSHSVANFKGYALSINPCQYQSTIHDLMSMVWAAVTAFCIIGMVGRTVREA